MATDYGRVPEAPGHSRVEPVSRLRPSDECPSRGVMIELPFPSAKLSGHQNAHWRLLQPVKKAHREWALKATLAIRNDVRVSLVDNSDIRVSVTFYPPDKRGDRTNYPNRMKPYWDGIADALCVNDRRFLPSFHFAEPVKDARVVVVIG